MPNLHLGDDTFSNAQHLEVKMEILDNFLNEEKVDSVILGCTELPDAFNFLNNKSNKAYNLIDPVNLIAEKIKELV